MVPFPNLFDYKISFNLFFILRFRLFFFFLKKKNNSFIRYNWYTVVHTSSVYFIVLDTCAHPQNHHCNQENEHICHSPPKKFSVPLCHQFSHSFQAPGNNWSVFCGCEFVFPRIFHKWKHKYPFFLSCFFHLAWIFWDSATLLCRPILYSFCCWVLFQSMDRSRFLVLLYSTGNYVQQLEINHNGKEYEKECVYIYHWITLLFCGN